MVKNIFLCCLYIPPIQEVGTDKDVFQIFFGTSFLAGNVLGPFLEKNENLIYLTLTPLSYILFVFLSFNFEGQS